jgi:hypothetical protein
MYLFLISQSENNDCDTYDSAVVVANNEDEARSIHPCGYVNTPETCSYSWAPPENVEVKLIGDAASSYTVTCVIVASFNAG